VTAVGSAQGQPRPASRLAVHVSHFAGSRGTDLARESIGDWRVRYDLTYRSRLSTASCPIIGAETGLPPPDKLSRAVPQQARQSASLRKGGQVGGKALDTHNSWVPPRELGNPSLTASRRRPMPPDSARLRSARDRRHDLRVALPSSRLTLPDRQFVVYATAGTSAEAEVAEEGLHVDADLFVVAVDGGPGLGFTSHPGAVHPGQDRGYDLVAERQRGSDGCARRSGGMW